MSIHVVPINDTKDHELEMECECKPIVEWGGEGGPYPSGPVVTHNSYSRREFIERMLGGDSAGLDGWVVISTEGGEEV